MQRLQSDIIVNVMFISTWGIQVQYTLLYSTVYGLNKLLQAIRLISC